MDAQQLLQEIQKYPDQMSNSERAAAYSRGEEVDRLPVAISVRDTNAPSYGCTIGEFRRSFEVRCALYERMATDFGAEGICLGPNLKKIGEAMGSKACYPENDIDYIRKPALSDYAGLEKLAIPDPRQNSVLAAILADMAAYRRRYGKTFPLSTEVGGPLTTAVSLRGTERLLLDLIDRPKQLHRLLGFCVAAQLAWVKVTYEDFGITGVNISDPSASASLIGTDHFRDFAAPHLTNLVEGIRTVTGKPPSLHICGRTKVIWPQLCKLGVASFRVDNCEDLTELKAAVGAYMGISGNIPPVEVLRNGTIDQVITCAKQCIAKAADCPCGYTLAAGCQIPIGTPKENILAMLFTAKKYGRHARMGYPCMTASIE